MTSTPSLSQMSRGSKLGCSSRLSQETDQFLGKPESSTSLKIKDHSHHSTTMAATSESFLNMPRESQKVEYSFEFTLTESSKSWTRSSTAQQNKSSNLVPLCRRSSLNPTLPECNSDVISSLASPPSADSSQSQSPERRSPDSPSSRSRLEVKPMNSRLHHSTSLSDQTLNPAPIRVIASPCTASSSSPAHDSIKFPIMEISSDSDGNNTPPPSRWLKGTRRSPQSATLSLQISLSGQFQHE